MISDCVIEVKNLHKKIGKLSIISDVSLKILKGERIAIIGANGSGKTTLIELICGITKPTSGKISINSDAIRIKRIGLQFQEGYWPAGVTPKAIIKYYVGKRANSEEIKKLIDIFGIKAFYNKHLNNLSGGEKQRFNAMLAIINDPEILILDELITGLDLKIQVKLINFFKEFLNDKHKTLLMISHIPEEVENLCDRFILLENGKVINDLKVKDIVSEYGSLRIFMEKYYWQSGE
ncbi:ABC transporter ATP-binding protein [Spiroplasma platyhelix]|uniref:ABC transporter ATP-binding protein n=1 Tax=Spiroplasma platyhelix PALS-1 TaxID=1276218 RepID=A0A846U9I3_9MOLU|nr:ABC transporter ATP-binding protein [Spiroplasma platyhelix]MBE4704162.1 ABC transporter ATP-binding protein NatA [Spiroplasma platyhelix PALS-1]NKE38533.1 ABC transporter ATP-binding protein [Spiroplasma platyhelix PALS-1]UJB29420.1 ABC transporter ATP-binding protein [Spiroplasma platyhelix PALS-1]